MALDRSFNQHHADIYVMLQMQQRLIAALQEAVFYGISDDWIDRTIIDPIVDGLARITRALSEAPRWLHNGLVPSYAMIMWLGVLGCVLIAMRLLPYYPR